MNYSEHELRKPINVPARRPSRPTHDSAWHISFMALLLVTSIVMIVFATFNSAHAFTIDHNTNQFERPLGYAAVEKNNSRIGLSRDELPRETLPNIEETAFNNMILWKAAERAGRELIEAPAQKVQHTIIVQSANDTRTMSKTERIISIGLLALLFAFMTWVTAKMWREFARSAPVKRR